MSVYPAGVKQARRELLSVDDGKQSLISGPCVIKSLSFAPYNENQEQNATVCLALFVYDGSTVIMKFPFIGPQYLSTNVPILFPADGIKINTSLSFEAERLTGSVSESSLNIANIRVAYQQ